MTPRLSVAPRPLPGETARSWIDRIAARHRLAPAEVMDGLVPGRARGWWKAGGPDGAPDPVAEAALAEAAGLPRAAVAALRDPAASVWPRRGPWPPWCPGCVRDDLERRGETHERSAWGFGGFVLCPAHRRALVDRCPRCGRAEACRPREACGRLRLCCDRCGDIADGADGPRGRGRSLRRSATGMDGAARRGFGGAIVAGPSGFGVVLALQADLLAAARGRPPGGRLSLGMPAGAMLGLVAALVPLVQRVDPYDWRSAFGPRHRPARGPADRRTPGRLPVERAFTALAAVAALLAEAAGEPRDDIVWHGRRSEFERPAPVRLRALVGSFAGPQRGAFDHLARRVGGPFAEAAAQAAEVRGSSAWDLVRPAAESPASERPARALLGPIGELPRTRGVLS